MRPLNPIKLCLLVATPIAATFAWDYWQLGAPSWKVPWALAALVVVPVAFWWLMHRRAAAPMQYASVSLLRRIAPGPVARWISLPNALRVVCIGLLIVALARPQTRDRGGFVEVDGIDIVLAVDLSKSMEATDLPPNRLEAAKTVIDEFIRRRSSDRIGLVVFGRQAYTECPLTLDYAVLRQMVGDLQTGLLDGTATAIGNGLGVSLARLRNSDAKSRVVILLTDGESNAGNLSPKEAARYAAAMKVKVFTIFVGADDAAGAQRERPGSNNSQYGVNPELLSEISASTGGRSFRALDQHALAKTFEEILAELDKNKRKDVAAVYQDAYRPALAWAIGLLLLEVTLLLTRFRRFP